MDIVAYFNMCILFDDCIWSTVCKTMLVVRLRQNLMAEQTSLSFLARFLPSRGTNLKASQGFPPTDLARTISQGGIVATKSRFFATLRSAQNDMLS
jgi:hypothetical protein